MRHNIIVSVLLIVILLMDRPIGMAQGIIAGQQAPGQEYVDFIPDLIVQEPDDGSEFVLEVDLDDDGNKDLKFTSFYTNGGQWFATRQTSIQPLNGMMLASNMLDSCMATDPNSLLVYEYRMMKNMDQNDTIDISMNFTDSSMIYCFGDYSANFPNGAGFSCSAGPISSTDTSFLAFKLNNAVGWMRVATQEELTNNCGLSVLDYAMSTAPLDVLDMKFEQSLLIYTNPTTGLFKVDGNDKSLLEVYDLSGRMIHGFYHPGFENSYDLSGLIPGTYIIKMKNVDGSVWVQKLVISTN